MTPLIALALIAAAAHEPQSDAVLGAHAEAASPSAWSVTIGAGAVGMPSYPGAASMRVMPMPIVDVQYRHLFFLSTVSGLGMNVIATRTLMAGFAVSPDLGRSASAADRLRGWGDISPGADLKLFGMYSLGPVALVANVIHQLSAGNGTLVDGGLTSTLPISRRFTLSATATVSWADARYTRAYFGVDGNQSVDALAHGAALSRYSAGGGPRDAALALFAVIPIDDHWSVQSLVRAEVLLGDAAGSPLTEKRVQPTLAASSRIACKRGDAMSRFLRAIVYLVVVAALPLGSGAIGFRTAVAAYTAPTPERLLGRDLPPAPALDPDQPTVAVVLGNDVTEVADTLAPYAAFKTAGAFNVVTVAERRLPVALSGGLDVVPDFSFAGLDARLGRRPDLIVVPNIVNVRGNDAVREWVRRRAHDGSLVMSVCAGAEMFAATGLIDGRRATTHWGEIGRIERGYPSVRWVRGQRYVDEGQFISTAGILSGIDGSLHMIDRLRGRALALQVARALHYDGARFLDDPAMPQFRLGLRDAIVVLNLAYGWDRATLDVELQDGVDELSLAAVYDTYAPTFVLASVAAPGAVITTRNGLHLVARRTSRERPASGGTLSPGRGDQRFAFDAALEDLARRQDVPTAEFAAKRLEYRAAPALRGDGWLMVANLYRPALLGLLGLLLVFALERIVLRVRCLVQREDGRQWNT